MPRLTTGRFATRSELELRVVEYYYFTDLTVAKIAKNCEVSPGAVNRILKKRNNKFKGYSVTYIAPWMDHRKQFSAGPFPTDKLCRDYFEAIEGAVLPIFHAPRPCPLSAFVGCDLEELEEWDGP